ncbi:uncharacterized protein PAN0_004d2184 [Moesziomyces antarcticus]|uniref:Uncharacterized protein n=2 Tax=Pseudozyma antarctica TaxID=84753 RepID=A0A081CBC9_PSEA2|nr:uncharacterized protein PAN0_004d2184 [Moesziomyces antarcticus]GAK63975.1 hypothetical protein PAN0_004d2184 [Moesziomyces antarcticus]SPO44814.1 uncharacterized protein PSANT_02500 [Moesziomyces antarcticus]
MHSFKVRRETEGGGSAPPHRGITAKIRHTVPSDREHRSAWMTRRAVAEAGVTSAQRLVARTDLLGAVRFRGQRGGLVGKRAPAGLKASPAAAAPAEPAAPAAAAEAGQRDSAASQTFSNFNWAVAMGPAPFRRSQIPSSDASSASCDLGLSPPFPLTGTPSPCTMH